MSVDNFIPQMWAAQIQATLRKQLVLSVLTNKDYEGEISAKGDSVRINAIGPVTVAGYTKNSTNVTPETLNDQSQVLFIDQANYFAFEVDDIDRRQASGDLLSAGMDEAAYALRDTADAYLSTLWADAGSASSDTAVNSVNVFAAVLTAAEGLDELNVPREGRKLIVKPWFHTKLVLAKVLVENSLNNDALTNGFVGRCGGFDIYVSNNLDDDSGYDKLLAGTNRSITFAEQINKVDAYRPEAAFSDAVKGLHLFGAKVVQPKCLFTLSVAETAEP